MLDYTKIDEKLKTVPSKKRFNFALSLKSFTGMLFFILIISTLLYLYVSQIYLTPELVPYEF